MRFVVKIYFREARVKSLKKIVRGKGEVSSGDDEMSISWKASARLDIPSPFEVFIRHCVGDSVPWYERTDSKEESRIKVTCFLGGSCRARGIERQQERDKEEERERERVRAKSGREADAKVAAESKV
jgi:hypothetical protein